MPIDITGEFQPSDGVHGFDLYDPQDIKAGNVNVILQAIAGGAFKGGSHATAPVGEIVPQVKTTTGAPTHSATEGTICWNSVDNILYVNSNGATSWSVIGVAGDSDQTILPGRHFSRSVGERPGGAVGAVQFNNSGIFGGIPIFTFDGTNLVVVTTNHLQFRDDTTEIHSSSPGFLRLRALTAARLQTGEFLVSSDDLARTLLDVLDVVGAVNHLEIKPSITTAPVLLTAKGTDASVSVNFVPKGPDGRLQVNGDEVATVLSGQVFGV
jgi:hypothetical protein